MLSIRGKLLIFALEIVAAVLLLFSIPPWEAAWVKSGLAMLSVLAIAFAVVMGRSIAGALDRLVAATSRIGAGDYNRGVTLNRSDEIGALAAEIDKMRVQLREKVHQLEAFSQGLERRVAERTVELTRANDRLRLIHEVTNAVNASLDLRLIFEAVVRSTYRLVEFEGASIARIQGGVARIVATSGREPAELGETRLARILSETGSAVFADQGDGRHELVLPLSDGQNVIGAWSLASRRPEAFAAPELALLQPIASDLAVALVRAESFEREREAARSLKELSDLKSDFVSRVSHELRTPLTSILGALDNLLDGIAGPLDGKALGYLVRMRENGRRLLGLITDLLDLARIESGEEELRLERCLLAGIVAEAVETVRALGDARGVTVESHVEPDLDLIADHDKIGRVLVNLVDNAIKFSEAGRRVEVHASRDGLGAVEVRVIDGGTGIPEAELERIFDKFHRVRSAGRARTPGSGLGLPICRELVAMHGGTLRAESRAGVGSIFIVTFPAPPAARGAA